MTSQPPDERFWEIADSFINLANQHLDSVGRGKVRTALLYAPARFNSFVVSASTEIADELKREKDRSF